MLGFLPDRLVLAALESAGDGLWREVGATFRYRMCVNYRDQAVCNWMVPEPVSGDFCLACELNHTIPNLGQESNRELWGEME